MPPELPSSRGACLSCRRRSDLLAQLGARIDHAARDLRDVAALLRLDDEALIATLGGRRRDELLRAAHAGFAPNDGVADAGVGSICPHSHPTPPPPTILHFEGRAACLRRALGEPPIAIVGTRCPSDYGVHVAAQLAGDLAAAGAQLIAPLEEGVAAAALCGAIARAGAPLAIAAGGLQCAGPSGLGGLRDRLSERGCLLAELPGATPPRRWSRRAAARVLVALVRAVIVLEAEPGSLEHQLALLAQERGKMLGAVPGSVASRRSAVSHTLIRGGATLVAGAEDALDLIGASATVPATTCKLAPRLAAVLDRVAGGEDCVEHLLSDDDPSGTLLAVAELEALRLIVRTAGGRYLPRIPARQLTPSDRATATTDAATLPERCAVER